MARFQSTSKKIEARTCIAGWQDREFVTVQRAAAVLDVSRTSMYSLVYKGEIDAAKIAGRTVIHTSSLKAFIKTVKPYVSAGPRGNAVQQAAA